MQVNVDPLSPQDHSGDTTRDWRSTAAPPFLKVRKFDLPRTHIIEFTCFAVSPICETLFRYKSRPPRPQPRPAHAIARFMQSHAVLSASSGRAAGAPRPVPLRRVGAVPVCPANRRRTTSGPAPRATAAPNGGSHAQVVCLGEALYGARPASPFGPRPEHARAGPARARSCRMPLGAPTLPIKPLPPASGAPVDQETATARAHSDYLADQKGLPRPEVKSWTPYPGGAPANVATALARLGVPTAFVSALGSDDMGEKMVALLAGGRWGCGRAESQAIWCAGRRTSGV
jgi:hypothetical protein